MAETGNFTWASAAGETWSDNFPLMNAWQSERKSYDEAFVVKLRRK